MFVEVEIKISDLLNDLRNGLTWLASEDKGLGSIQIKYEMEDQDVEDIKQHPAFQRTIRTFKIVDDTARTPTAQVTIEKEVEIASLPELEVQDTESTGALEFLSL